MSTWRRYSTTTGRDIIELGVYVGTKGLLPIKEDICYTQWIPGPRGWIQQERRAGSNKRMECVEGTGKLRVEIQVTHSASILAYILVPALHTNRSGYSL